MRPSKWPKSDVSQIGEHGIDSYTLLKWTFDNEGATRRPSSMAFNKKKEEENQWVHWIS